MPSKYARPFLIYGIIEEVLSTLGDELGSAHVQCNYLAGDSEALVVRVTRSNGQVTIINLTSDDLIQPLDFIYQNSIKPAFEGAPHAA